MSTSNEAVSLEDAAFAPTIIIGHIEERLQNVVSDLSVMRQNEFFNDPNFLPSLSSVTLSRILTILDTPFKAAGERVAICAGESERNHSKAVLYNSPPHLEMALAVGAVGVKSLMADDPLVGVTLNILGKSLRQRWWISGEMQALKDAIYYFSQAIELGPADNPNRGLHFNDLGCAFLEQFQNTRSDTHFDKAKENLELAIDIGDSERPLYISNLGRLLKEKAVLTLSGALAQEALDESLASHMKAIDTLTTAFRHPLELPYQYLAEAYFKRHAVDLAEPVKSIKLDVQQCVDFSGHRAMFFHQLGRLYNNRFARLRDSSDLEISICLLRESLSSDSSNAAVHCLLGNTLKSKSHRDNSLHLLSEAADHFQQGVDLSMSNPDAQFPERLLQYSSCLFDRFEMTGSLDDLNVSINLSQISCNSLLPENTERWKSLKMLGIGLMYRFQIIRNFKDIDLAQSSLKTALEFKGMTAKDRAECLRQLGKLVYEIYQEKKDEILLQQAINSFTEAISLLSNTDDPEIAQSYNDLGNALQMRFQNQGNPRDLRESISYYLNALECLEQIPNYLGLKADRAMFLVGLANSHFLEFQRWGRREPLENALSFFRQAIEATEPFDRMLPSRVIGYCWAMQYKSDITEDTSVLSEAEKMLLSALQLQPPPPLPVLSSLHNSLAGVYYRIHRKQRSNDFTALNKAIDQLRSASNTGTSDHAVIAGSNLLVVLAQKFKETQAMADLFAIVTELRALAGKEFRKSNAWGKRGKTTHMAVLSEQICNVMANNPLLSAALGSATLIGGLKDVAVKCFLELFSDQENSSADRIRSALKLAGLKLNAGEENYRAVADYLMVAVELLPDAILMGTNRKDQMRLVKEFSTLSGLVLSVALAAGDSTAAALRIYERSRCIIWDRLIDQKVEITELQDKHEDLAKQFVNLRALLSLNTSMSATSSMFTDGLHINMQQNSREWALQYNELISLIRKQEGFKDFLMLPSDDLALSNYASKGAVILINAPGPLNYCSAVIIQGDKAINLHLPGITSEACLKHSTTMLQAIGSTYEDLESSKATLDSTLVWLWKAAALPILTELGYDGKSGGKTESMPRIWWVQNGWTSVFPIHAAGDHKRALQTGDCCTVLDRVISSYIPTLKALDFARTCAIRLKADVHDSVKDYSILIAYMPTTPDASDLPGVEREVAVVKKLSKNVLVLKCPEKSDITAAFNDYSIAHFACHGVADQEDPLKSMLMLQDWKANPFDVSAILETPMKNCQLVFLSACETAVEKVKTLREEVIHMSAALHMVGVPYVIATKWTIEDILAVKITERFYKGLTSGGCSDSARALHNALVFGRKKGVHAIFWGAYIHSGA